MNRWEVQRSMLYRSCLGVAGALALACGGHDARGPYGEEPEPEDTTLPDPVDEAPTEPTLEEIWTLDALPEGAVPVGITQNPTTLAVYVLATNSGLYKMGLDGPELVFDTTNLDEDGIELQSDFTDVVALSEARFALTAKNEGFLLDLIDESLTLFFCYLPSEPIEPEPTTTSVSVSLEEQGVDVYQTTQAVAHDPAAQLLYAQPLTVDSQTGEVYAAEVGAFWDDTGEPANWLTLDDASFQATGMVSLDGDSFTFVTGSEVYRVGRNGLTGPPIADLSSDGIEDIAGLAPRLSASDTETAFWLLDGAARKVYKLDLPPL